MAPAAPRRRRTFCFRWFRLRPTAGRSAKNRIRRVVGEATSGGTWLTVSWTKSAFHRHRASVTSARVIGRTGICMALLAAQLPQSITPNAWICRKHRSPRARIAPPGRSAPGGSSGRARRAGCPLRFPLYLTTVPGCEPLPRSAPCVRDRSPLCGALTLMDRGYLSPVSALRAPSYAGAHLRQDSLASSARRLA